MSESARASVSFTSMPPGVLENCSQRDSAEDIQISLAPYIQSYLTQTERRHSCCSVMLPVAFERAAPKSWMDPRFDSPVLEGQFRSSVFPQLRLRFRFALVYILLCSLVWLVYFLVGSGSTAPGTLSSSNPEWPLICISLALFALCSIVGLVLTYSTFYRRYTRLMSGTVALALCFASLFFLVVAPAVLTPLGHFAISMEIITLIYTLIPLPLWESATIALCYSLFFEIVAGRILYGSIDGGTANDVFYKSLAVRCLLQLTVHLVGVHVLIMNVVRMRGTFMKVGQNLLVRRQLEMEKQLKEKMIHSVMPPKVAAMLLKEGGPAVTADNNTDHNGLTQPPPPPDRKSYELRPRPSNDVKSLFRPFHMHSVENVSILFADIVGFTRMSSTKTAEQLVEILNDLFERFDGLCTTNGCEKISTLGDCYYCVSGCPEPRPDHAICCVEMGLSMIEAVQVFDAQRNEGVKMRVGVHTGTVLCGIVGTRRVKFDVWSNDVSLANKMESSGRPEQVHISEETCSFIGDGYLLEEGDQVCGHRTFFVLAKRLRSPGSYATDITAGDMKLVISPPADTADGYTDGEKLSRSATNLSVSHPLVPPASPAGPVSSTSLSPSPQLTMRPRIASLSKLTKLISVDRNGVVMVGKKHPTPDIIVTARSFPGGLDSDPEDEGCCRSGRACKVRDNRKFAWRVPRFLKKIDGTATTTTALTTAANVECGDVRMDDIPQIELNGYQQLPLVIESPHLSCHNLELRGASICCGALGNAALFDDIIDVRSYISQSRSDISPFARTGSYRSQCGGVGGGGRSPQCDDVSPITRPRSSTVSHRNLPVPVASNLWMDGLSLCPSATASRKDSGIRSNSRRSSIQQQINAMNQMNSGTMGATAAANATGPMSVSGKHRVSGYFTSSQSSLSGAPDPVPTPLAPHPDPLAACLQQLRKQSDLQLIRCVRDNAKSQRSYLVKPPLSNWTLFFKSRSMEREFRSKAHRFGAERDPESPPTLATPRYNTYIDIIVGIVVFLAISVSLFLLAPHTFDVPYRIWAAMFATFAATQFLALVVCTKQMYRRSTTVRTPTTCVDRLFESISNWYPWHLCGAFLTALPVISILVNFHLRPADDPTIEHHYGFLIFVCVIHFCNFTQLNCWMRNLLAFIAATGFAMIAISKTTHSDIIDDNNRIHNNNNNNANSYAPLNINVTGAIINHTLTLSPSLSASLRLLRGETSATPSWIGYHQPEIFIDIVLLLLLVWFLNREYEIGYRLTFYGSAVANQDKIRVQNMKNQADMLLHNIIPKHVAEQLKNTAKYSENHFNVGIIFASIINFNELYDESYLRGKEYLRVLNELIGDFDELLSRPEFRCVEKIKTIGSSFMAASGLDPSSRGHGNTHLTVLMDFAIAMQEVVEAFNNDLLEFNLILRIGYNYGDVTAGVIGTSKLYYDIWGDAVNVASRMDSTGVAGRIQVGSACVPMLEHRFEFEARGNVYVKGKDHMEVYLMVCRKPTEQHDNNAMN